MGIGNIVICRPAGGLKGLKSGKDVWADEIPMRLLKCVGQLRGKITKQQNHDNGIDALSMATKCTGPNRQSKSTTSFQKYLFS